MSMPEQRSFGFIRRVWAIFIKELTHMRRDKLTFAMMFGIPIIQLMLFGFAINTDPKNLPTAVITEEQSPIIRTMLTAMEISGYYDFVLQTDDAKQGEKLLAQGDVVFVVTFPVGFTQSLIRGDRPQVIIEADASDPAATSNAINRAETILSQALRHEFKGSLEYLTPKATPYDLVIHLKYNPEGITQYNIIPGLLGVILTMTLVMITSMAMTRETERGTLENLLAFPAKASEVMIGKIAPYIAVGLVQTVVILLMARYLFTVPFLGDLWVLMTGIGIFVVANLALGFTFSTIAKTQMQAMQLTFFFFLPSMLLSGFMFPFRGMPSWAQFLGEALPLTHFLRIVRGVMLKGTGFSDIHQPLVAMSIFTAIICGIAMMRYRRTLD